jgi:putative colanic acid biosynthesis glycosyltransferase
MPKVFQIVIESNKGSVGRIAEQIGDTVLENGWESYVTYARESNPSTSKTLKIGSKYDVYWHGIETRIFDNHCFSSRSATNGLIKMIKEIKPDVIHMHHLHGYYINIEILFKYLKESELPLVWTFHDCWSFTGHCAYFEYVGCDKWKTQCYDCEQKNEYPKSLIFDRSRQNYIDKKRIFNSVDNMTIVPVSNWLEEKVKESFLKDIPCRVIQNGIDLDMFYPRGSRQAIQVKLRLKGKFMILGVASTWEKRKGLDEFVKLSKLIEIDIFVIVLIGLSESQIKSLPENIIGIQRTENVGQLADFYSAADVFLNPTLEDTFPTTNLESLACGTPVITYRTGGSVESVNIDTGLVVEQGDVSGLMKAINNIRDNGKEFYSDNCRKSAIKNFDKRIKFNDYFELYTEILKNK